MSSPSLGKITSHESIIRDVQAGNFSPVYYLMGEEGYYTDRIADYIVERALTPDEQDLNLITLYGGETNIVDVMDQAKAYPMLGEHLVVRVNEAQRLGDIELLEHYLKAPQPSTILVFCHKGGSLDKRKRISTLIDKVGVLFESKPLKDAQLQTFVTDYMRRKNIAIAPDAASMMVDTVGADLTRMAGELDKLIVALGNEKTVDLTLVERHIGLSREFNIFELQDALAQKDAPRIMKIGNYFAQNAKLYPLQRILPSLFKFYSNAMLAYYSPDKSDRGIAAWLGVTDWQVRKNVLPMLKNYSGVKVMQIIAEIRKTDALSKGVGGSSSVTPGELLKQLLFFILH